MNISYTPFNPPVKFWTRSWPAMIQLIANGLIKSSLVILSYFQIKELTRQIKLDQQLNIQEILPLVVIALVVMILRVHERYIAEKMSQKYINRIRSGLLKRIMRASIREIQSKAIGNLSSRLAGDLNSVKRWLSLGISRLITHSLLLIITLLLIFNINVNLGLTILFSIMALLLFAVFMGSKLKTSIKNVRRNRIKIHSLLVERLASMETIRAMGKEQYEIRKINRQANKLERNISIQGLYLGFLRGIGDASSMILIAVFFTFQFVMKNQLTLEEMTALISIILFLNSPIRELGRVQEYYQGAKLSLEKLKQLYAIPRIIRGRSKQHIIEKVNINLLGNINIQSIYLKNIFNGFNVNATKSDHIALIGKNGSGKSTLIQLILGQIKADSGTIKVNGVSPQNYLPESRSKNIGVSGVNHKIMKGSLISNLTYRCDEFQPSKFKSLLETCQLDKFIKKLPVGLNTKVKENGSNFSSGENARISLFRALLGEPEILILDEPESYLDNTGMTIIKSLLREYEGTIIIATHHAELIALCHKVWDLNKTNKPVKLLKNKKPMNTVSTL